MPLVRNLKHYSTKAESNTAISRKVVGKNVHATVPKGNMGYDLYTFPNDCSCRIYFCCFHLAAHKHTSMASHAILSYFFEEQ